MLLLHLPRRAVCTIVFWNFCCCLSAEDTCDGCFKCKSGCCVVAILVFCFAHFLFSCLLAGDSKAVLDSSPSEQPNHEEKHWEEINSTAAVQGCATTGPHYTESTIIGSSMQVVANKGVLQVQPHRTDDDQRAKHNIRMSSSIDYYLRNHLLLLHYSCGVATMDCAGDECCARWWPLFHAMFVVPGR